MDLYLEMNHGKALQRRLIQIWGEDISAASPYGIKFLDEEESFEKKIAYLCSCFKNRESDRFLITVSYAPELLKNIDKQTWRESFILQKLLQELDSWFNEESRKEKNLKKKRIEEMFSKLKGENVLNEVLDLCLENYFLLTKSKVHGARVLIAAAVLISLRKMKKETVDLSKISYEREDIENIPDYVLDIHTPIGKKMGRDIYHWAKEGTKVIPQLEYPELFNKKGEEKYPLKEVLPFIDERKKRYQKT